jgi:predicted PurR-regulated permease PerM
VVSEIHNLSSNFPTLRGQLLQHVHESERTWPLDKLPDSVRTSIDNTISNLDKTVGRAVHAAAPAAVHEVPGLLELLVVPIVAYYLLKDGADFLHFPRGLLSEDHRPRFDRLIEEIDESLRGYLKGQLTLGLLGALLAAPVAAVINIVVRYLMVEGLLSPQAALTGIGTLDRPTGRAGEPRRTVAEPARAASEKVQS